MPNATVSYTRGNEPSKYVVPSIGIVKLEYRDSQDLDRLLVGKGIYCWKEQIDESKSYYCFHSGHLHSLFIGHFNDRCVTLGMTFRTFSAISYELELGEEIVVNLFCIAEDSPHRLPNIQCRIPIIVSNDTSIQVDMLDANYWTADVPNWIEIIRR